MKRKRNGYKGVTRRSNRPYRPTKGYVRTGGYYGRFAGKNAEKKFFDTTRASHIPAQAGTISNLSLNLIPQGTTESQRIGRKCVIKSLFIKGYILSNATSDENKTSDRMRIIVYQDKQCNGATAAVTDILETAAINSFRNLAESGRFKILKDKTYVTGSPGGSYNGTNDLWAAKYVNLRINFANLNIPLEFNSTTGAITEIRSNNIGILALSELGTPSQTLAYTARVRFSDGS